MFRGRVVAGAIVLCTVGSLATAQAPQGVSGFDAQGWSAEWRGDRTGRGLVRNPPRWSGHEPVREARVKEFIIPAGRCYTSIVITPMSKGTTNGSSRKITIFESQQPFSVALGNESFVLNFPKGWDVNCRATICGDLCDGDFEAFGITDKGPVAFAVTYR